MSKRTKIVAGAAVAVVAAAVAGILWWTLRDDGPAAVDLGAAVAQLETPADADMRDPVAAESDDGEGVGPESGSAGSAGSGSGAEVTVDPEPVVVDEAPSAGARSDAGDSAVAESDAGDGGELVSGSAESADPAGSDSREGAETPVTSSTLAAVEEPPSTPGGGETEAPSVASATDSVAGLWKVITAEGADALAGEGAVSFAGFRVQEVLAGGIGENTAVGRTADVSGYIELTDTALVGTKVIVTMTTVRTDDSHRDHHMREVLNTDEFPLAAFVLTEPVGLPAASFDGEPFSGSAKGDLTIKGVTRHVAFDLQAQLAGDVIVVVGSSEVVFSDFGVPTPRSAAVLSVEDDGIMEFQLYFTR